MNKIIDVNYYPVPEAEHSNKKHRPIGIGVQGLADVFVKMRMPFGSMDSRILNYIQLERYKLLNRNNFLSYIKTR